jgi:FkbM family methyltransferase
MADSTSYRFTPSTGWITHLWKSATRQDHAHLRPALRTLMPPDGVAIDVGAHGGQVTRLLSGLVPRGTVIAVEPSGYARSVLRPALWARRARNVVVVAGALGATQGVAVLRTPIKRRGDMGYGLAHISANGPEHTHVAETVLVTTLDLLVQMLALGRVDFIKVDIEGYEAALVAGALETLRQFRPALLLEHDAGFTSRAGFDLPALWAQLVALDYRPHTLSGATFAPVPQAQWPREGDVFWLPQSSAARAARA